MQNVRLFSDTRPTLFICTACRFSKTEQERAGLRGGQHLWNQFCDQQQTEPECHPFCLQAVSCMGACSRSCVVAFAGLDKTTFIFGDLSPLEECVADLLQFSDRYFATTKGDVPYADRPTALKQRLVAKLPAFPHS